MLVGSFAMEPIAGVLIELVKILVHLVTKGSMTAGVGDVANFIFGCTFAVPAGLIYRYKSVKSRKHAVIGMAVGTVLTAVVACFINAFVLLPAYGKAFGMPVEAFIEMGSVVHSSVNNLLTFAAMIIFPFNIFKYIEWENNHCCKCKKIIYRAVYYTSHFDKCFYRHSKSLSVCRK